MGGLKIFKVSLHSWQRVLILLFYEDLPSTPILPTPTPLFQILSTHPPPPPLCHLLPLPLLFSLLPCFFGWMGDHATFDVLFCLGTLVPWDVFYTTRRQVYGGLTHCGFLLVLWFDIKHTHTKHTQRPVDWYTHINIYLHHLLCAHSSYLYYIKWLNI